MGSVLVVLFPAVRDLCRRRSDLEAELLALRHQVVVLQRRRGARRVQLHRADRVFWVLLSRLWPRWRKALVVVKPETVIAWHRRAFGWYWRWKSRARSVGRPPRPREVIELIRAMRQANPTWGAPRIHGELLKLGIDIGESTVSTYLPTPPRRPPSQGWRAFLHNHLAEMIAIDCAVVPTITGHLLFVFIVLSLARRKVLHVNVTAHPTAAWTAQQMVEALPWTATHRSVIRDRGAIYGKRFRERVAGLGVEEVVIAPRSPWQNGCVERFIGSLRRECLDHVIAIDGRQWLRIVQSYVTYHNRSRTHLSLGKDAPDPQPVQSADAGEIVAVAEVGGLHHRYERRMAA